MPPPLPLVASWFWRQILKLKIQEDTEEEDTGGLHYCQIEPFQDDAVREGEDARELADLHARAEALCHGFLGPFRVRWSRLTCIYVQQQQYCIVCVGPFFRSRLVRWYHMYGMCTWRAVLCSGVWNYTFAVEQPPPPIPTLYTLPFPSETPHSIHVVRMHNAR